MSRGLNKTMLIGNVGADPDVRTTGGGVKLAKVSLATSRTFKDRNGQQQEKTEWHRLTFWDKSAEIVEQYVKKGDRLYVEGRLEYSNNGKEGDEQRWFTDIVVTELVMLGNAQGNGGATQPRAGSRTAATPRAPAPSPFDDDDDDLPF